MRRRVKYPPAAAGSASHRTRLRAGWMYEFAEATPAARGGWRAANDHAWYQVQTRKTLCGKLVGHRRIGGAPVAVVRVRGALYASVRR